METLRSDKPSLEYIEELTASTTKGKIQSITDMSRCIAGNLGSRFDLDRAAFAKVKFKNKI